MDREIRRMGWIMVAPELFLDWLQLEGGYILDARRNIERDCLEFLIEHPDMPDKIRPLAEHVELIFEMQEERSTSGSFNAVIRSGQRVGPKRPPPVTERSQ